MRPENKTMRADAAQTTDDARQHATHAEVEAGLAALTEADQAKLVMIATSFCKQRCLAPGVIEPKELVSEAVLKTLQCEEGKRWNKKVSLVKHLDRAMENISGHLAGQRTKIVPFTDGLQPDESEFCTANPEDALIEAESLSSMLRDVFGDDLQAREIFAMRMDGHPPLEIQGKLNLTPKQYETINRRILRIIAAFVPPTKA